MVAADHQPRRRSSSLLSLLRELRDSPQAVSNPVAFSALMEPHLHKALTDPPSVLIPPVFDLMLQHPGSTVVQTAGTQLLANLTYNDPIAAKAVADGKGIQLLFHTLLMNNEDHVINSNALRALSAIVPVAEGIGSTVYQFFGVDAVVAAAKSFIDDLGLQYAALRILLPLAESDDGDDDPAALRRAGHARAALRALKRYRREEELARLSCELLHYVVRHADGESLEQLRRIGTTRMLAATIVLWKDDDVIMEQGMAALAGLSRGDEECAQQFAEIRGIELAIRAMRRFRRSASLQLSSVLVLRSLADLDDKQALVMYNAGGLEAVISCMIEFRKYEEIQEHAIWLLDRLAWLREDVRLKIISVGGLKTISATLKTHIMNEELVEMGARTLRRIRSNK